MRDSSSLFGEALSEIVEGAVKRALAEECRPPERDLLHERGALSVQETAEVLGVSARQVRRWIDSGELVPIDLSGDRRLIGTDQILTKLAAANDRRRNCGEAPK